MGQETGVRDHPVVGTHRLPVDVPRALQHLQRLGHPERRPGQLFAQTGDLPDGGQVREQDPARVQRLLGVLHDPPGLGQVEQDPVEVAAVDPLVDVADLDVEGEVGTEEPLDVGLRPAREVVAELVTGHVTLGADRAQQREGAARPSPPPTRGHGHPGTRRRAPGWARGPSGR